MQSFPNYVGEKAKDLSHKAGDVVSQIRKSQNDYNTSDIDFYAVIADEIASNQINSALMTKALALADGDEKAANAKYIKLRYIQLKEERENAIG